MNTDATLAPAGEGKIYVGGQFVAASGGSEEVVEKATGDVLGRVGLGTAEDVDRAVAAARAAQAEWAAAPWQERASVLRGTAAAIERRREELLDMIVRETGAIRPKAEYEVDASVSYLHDAASLAARAGGSIVPGSAGKTNLVERVPVGVVGIISPWNFPMILGMYVAAPALALGNAAIQKPASLTPICGGQLLAELFAEGGAPAGVYNVVTGGGGAVGESLVAHPGVAMIHFTGSTEVGRRINELAARDLKRVSLEMGGNNALVVLDDADLETASMIGAWSSFHYQGQTCISASRHIVMRELADRYVEALAARAAGITLGDPFRSDAGLGPMISEEQRDLALGFMRESVAMGAEVVEGGTFDGLYVRPTVLRGVTPEMPAYREELFAPIAPVTVVDSEEEAAELTNATEFGLVNAVVSGDPMRGLAFARKIESGMVHVNDATCLVETNVPFGGRGASGVGWPTGGDADLDQFTERKWVSLQAPGLEYPY